MNDFYVYLLVDPASGEPFYVGKGRGRRASAHLKTRREKNWKKRMVITAIRRAGFEPQIVFVCTGMREDEAFCLEISQIAAHGRRPAGKLVNMSDGGEGQAGHYPTPEVRAKISRAVSGKNNPFYGKKHSPEALAKIGAINRGKVLNAAWRAKLGAAIVGRPKSAEHRAKISAALKGRIRTPEHNRKLAAGNTGKIISEKTRAAISAALKGRPKTRR